MKRDMEQTCGHHWHSVFLSYQSTLDDFSFLRCITSVKASRGDEMPIQLPKLICILYRHAKHFLLLNFVQGLSFVQYFVYVSSCFVFALIMLFQCWKLKLLFCSICIRIFMSTWLTFVLFCLGLWRAALFNKTFFFLYYDLLLSYVHMEFPGGIWENCTYSAFHCFQWKSVP